MVLFQGNVKGEFINLEEGKKIEQTWRLPQWPEGTALTPHHTDDRILLQFDDDF